MEVKVRLDNTNQPEFKNLMSLASSGEQPLTVDTEEVDRVNRDTETAGGGGGGGSRSKQSGGGKGGQNSPSRNNSRQTDSRKCKF